MTSTHDTVHLLGPVLASVPNYWDDLSRLLLGERLSSETDLMFLTNKFSKEEKQGPKGWGRGVLSLGRSCRQQMKYSVGDQAARSLNSN